MILLFIIRDLECLPKAWRMAKEILLFERRQMGKSSSRMQRTIPGIWINRFLLPPSSLKPVCSFGSSGFWSLCELGLSEDVDAALAACRAILVSAVFHPQRRGSVEKNKEGGIFMPVFKASESKRFILREMDRFESKYPGMISRFAILNLRTGNIQAEETRK